MRRAAHDCAALARLDIGAGCNRLRGFPLREKVLPKLSKIEGYRGGYVLRLDGPAEVEFVTVNLFESLEAVKRFAGSDYMTPVFEPEAQKLLCRIEPIAHHYDVRVVQ